jgi:BON domain
LEKAVRAKFENDAQLKVADLSVNADAERNEITLSGTVRSHAAREKAIELAKSAKPGVLVNDQIDVKPGGPDDIRFRDKAQNRPPGHYINLSFKPEGQPNSVQSGA